MRSPLCCVYRFLFMKLHLYNCYQSGCFALNHKTVFLIGCERQSYEMCLQNKQWVSVDVPCQSSVSTQQNSKQRQDSLLPLHTHTSEFILNVLYEQILRFSVFEILRSLLLINNQHNTRAEVPNKPLLSTLPLDIPPRTTPFSLFSVVNPVYSSKDMIPETV